MVSIAKNVAAEASHSWGCLRGSNVVIGPGALTDSLPPNVGFVGLSVVVSNCGEVVLTALYSFKLVLAFRQFASNMRERPK